MKPYKIHLHPDPPSLARRVAQSIAQEARHAIDARGRFTLVLAGGSTPLATYSILAHDHARDIPWSSVVVLFGDERCVGPDHEHSNFRMAAQSLLTRVGVLPHHVHRIRAEAGSSDAAREYDHVLRNVLAADPERAIDLALLGMGTDGHTASLFPGRDTASDSGRLAVPATAPPGFPIPERVTLTPEALARSRSIHFLVTGSDKQQTLASVLRAADSGGDPTLPASTITALDRVEWHADRQAHPQG